MFRRQITEDRVVARDVAVVHSHDRVLNQHHLALVIWNSWSLTERIIGQHTDDDQRQGDDHFWQTRDSGRRFFKNSCHGYKTPLWWNRLG